MRLNEAAILFDIDGTLMHAKGAGREAFGIAFREAYGVAYPDMEKVSFVGATDLGVVRKMATACGCVSTPGKEEHFSLLMAKRLDDLMDQTPPHRFPRVPEFLGELVKEKAVLGLATGNIRSTAWSKVRHIGVDHFFTFGGYGNDDQDRNKIAFFACSRCPASHRPALLVGDTPRDVEAGHALGIPVLAVGTGWVSMEDLAASGADSILPDFSDIPRTMDVVKKLVASVP